MGRGRHSHSRRHARRRSRSGREVTALEREHNRRGTQLAEWREINSGLREQVNAMETAFDCVATASGYSEPRGIIARIREAWRVLLGRRATMDVVGANRYRKEASRETAPAKRGAAVGGAA